MNVHVARGEAIGSTLYDKKWVIKTVLSLGSEEEGNRDELASLVDMGCHKIPELSKLATMYHCSRQWAHTVKCAVANAVLHIEGGRAACTGANLIVPATLSSHHG